jgi:predicted porin
LQKLSRGQVGVIDHSYGDADGSFNSSRQNLSATGRIAKKFFYSAGVSGEADDVDAVDAQNLHLRLAYDITDKFMVGALLIDGNAASKNREYSRYGIDSQLDFRNSRFNLAYIAGSDDVCGADDCTGLATSEEDNDALSAQWFYTFTTDGGRPTFVPLVRFDRLESDDGSSVSENLTLNLTYYFRENVRAYIEYWDHNAPTSAEDDSRVTLQAYFGF